MLEFNQSDMRRGNLPPIDLIALDADDTLWHTESLYVEVQKAFTEAFSPDYSPAYVQSVLDEIEGANIPFYGYGIKAFMLSMIETSARLSNGKLDSSKVSLVIELGKRMLTSEITLLDQVQQTLETLADTYPLIVITKGDLLDQQAKLEKSGIKNYFKYIEVVTEKTVETYTSLIHKLGVSPANFLMVGNSLRSDILPVVEIGAHAVYIPYHTSWVHEQVELNPEQVGLFHELEHIYQLPELLLALERKEIINEDEHE